MSEVKTLSKVTIEFLKRGLKTRGLKESLLMGRIYGNARKGTLVPMSTGEAYKFVGEFVAIRTDGDMGIGASCYLTPKVTATIRELLEGGAEGVNFGYDVYAIPSKDSEAGFVFGLTPLMEPETQSSALAFAEDFPPLEIKPVPKADPDPTEAKPEADKAKGKGKA